MPAALTALVSHELVLVAIHLLGPRSYQCVTSTFECPGDSSQGDYLCLDPDSREYLCKDVGVHTICETCIEFMGALDRTRIGDGHCDSELNKEGCLWDGGKGRTEAS